VSPIVGADGIRPTEEDQVAADVDKLRRQNGMVAGVCGGLAEWTGISVFWFRLAFALLLLPGGLPGLVPYFVLWVIIPRK
jgi:phage shock protein PspC (stress-responsive transcriptional regulator)